MTTTQFIPVRPTIHGAGTSVTATPAPPIDTSDFAVPEDPAVVTKTHNKALVYTLIVIAVILLILLLFLTYHMTQKSESDECDTPESTSDPNKSKPRDHQACAVLPAAPSGGGSEHQRPASKQKPTDASIAEEMEFLNSIKSKKTAKNKSHDSLHPPVQQSHNQSQHQSQTSVSASAALSAPIAEPVDQLPSLRQPATVNEPNNVITEPSSSLWTLQTDNDKDFNELFDDRKSVNSVKSAKSDKSTRSVKIVGPYDMVPIPTYVKQEALSKPGPESETLRNGTELTLRQWYDMSTTYKHPKFNRFIATNKMQSAFKSAGLKN